VHSSLERLEAKRYLASAVGEPTGGRGGRRRRVFSLTRDGRAALRDVRDVRQRLLRTSSQ
jgi:DNA-binding PadR family transcriptional regulator